MAIYFSILGFLLGFGIVIFTIPPLIRVSIAKHLYDTPNERKASKVIVPTLGGVAIFIGFILSTIVATDGYVFNEMKYLIAAVIIMFFIGLKDDLMDISATKKLAVEIATACMLIGLGNFRFTNLQGAFGLHEINYATSFVITLITMIGLINAFNLIDGIDGLASGISIVISSVFGTWFLLAGHHAYGIMCFSLAGSLIGFFIFNVFGKKNKIFMGDTGSLILGVVMVILVIKFNELNINQSLPYAIQAAPVVSIGILIIPIIDTLRVIFIRLSEKRSPFSPDMNHIHHNFLKLGCSHFKSTSFMVLMNVLFIGFAFAFHRTLNINNLIISIFTLGFIVAYIPNLIRKLTQSPVYSTEKPILRNDIKRSDIIASPVLSIPNLRLTHSVILKKKIRSEKEMVGENASDR
ncbi:MAG TPA: MraY family glycosyltransferase [Prolixibacteraceae bacterium]|jgi:UDP-N-acetylmuramyl pentapeptide phosphotransferase/UDP-N-acetylglucosamine-1-phosphate transferase